ncbi:bifunctional hydroxymethylpyrimidine kinase/phosphomethylpyrimidine kinase [Pajaroellobacter abortibovis]|uniref:hydroxymethylpyrimidine kinase n=1 Tax=Pajaroellobacter abortibovis TaxID=1882918 RepID=A0A1L6MWD3_9BACT|nr:bifunctional hydroxymethylpyrimidine kinase/phosphomethylpyrimidine kinase [Pajaroellobacter abortibovis]APR99784.1 bifunctional hydroxymethylpyrimidine kinase/phosphomethylpyrimidine kinase [Pajaroellobacter abortibovis]
MTLSYQRLPRVLTIAGSDSGGGAGIQGDLKTIAALGCFGTSVITVLTAQNTQGVRSIFEVSPQFVSEQLQTVLEDIGTDAIKTGMLYHPEIIREVANVLKRYPTIPIVVDPVMTAKGGATLLQQKALIPLREALFPLASILTPNLPEAEMLIGYPIKDESPQHQEKAATELLVSLGPQAKAVVLKGGHYSGTKAKDCVCLREDNRIRTLWMKAPRIHTQNTHGTGCTLSSAIACFLAKGWTVAASIEQAKKYVTAAIQKGASIRLGQGHGPLHHFYSLSDLEPFHVHSY